ncbi:group II intron reverse transcriptase/maturase [Enterocloster clostridioformis]|uniref:group II intron reverse transcriptase/maturase n=1 Tax=Enterocloster clostridioformis TaxID=1531 RepID=UPI0022E3D7F2|nr:group II intron reverse transcriptase/maturase [Enterocloster clostridioformis]
MPKKNKNLCVDDLRHAEYYGMQPVFDELYRRSLDGDTFTDLMDLILRRDNILLAYRNIKANGGSYTAGTDNRNITDIGCLPPETVVEKVRFIVTGSQHGYRPKPVRRKDIPKPNGKTRPLGIPCIWDRLIQQCIKQVMEPICEAKFSDNSYGFRPNRSVEHAMQRTYTMLQRMNLHYVIEFDIKGFFDNVNHSKLVRQIWALGMHDKQLIFIIKRILKAPIKMPDGSTVIPDRGTPQGGIISPLLANIVLNELDKWVESQWQNNPVAIERGRYRLIGNREVFDKSHGYRVMKNTNLKEMYIVRYADDFRIFCRNKEDAVKTKEAVTAWITERLRLEVSPEKTRIVNVRKRYSEFLGFKIRVRPKSGKYTVQSHICDKKLELERQKLVEQAKRIARPSEGKRPLDEIRLYNSMVLGIQNYFQLATCISIDCRKIHRQVMTVLTNRLNTETGCKLVREGGAMTESEKERFGKSAMVRYVSGIDQPIYPIAYIKNKIPMAKKAAVCNYTSDGRALIHTSLSLNPFVLAGLRSQPSSGRRTELTDSTISLFSAQRGKCALSGELFENAADIVCWLKTPAELGGKERYQNMVLFHKRFLPLLQNLPQNELKTITDMLKPSKQLMLKVNSLREQAGLSAIGK